MNFTFCSFCNKLSYLFGKYLNRKSESQEEDNRLSPKVIEQIKGFNRLNLTSEQQLLIEELIPKQELRKKYRDYGLCQECWQINNRREWCEVCNAKHFQKDFKNWTSGNPEIDKFIRNQQLKANRGDQILEWIPYNKIIDVEYLAQGGFSKVYKAKWTDGNILNWNINESKWNRHDNKKYGIQEVVLKILDNSQSMDANFLQETMYHKLLDFGQIAQCYGISQDPKTKNYIMVMKYFPNGNLRQYLKDNYNKLNFWNELGQLLNIARGLNQIHQQGLTHRDLHIGNVLNNGPTSYITDLGLCRPINEKDKEKVYGVLPYIAPEVLRREPYTSASDVYSFGMIMYETFSKIPPYVVYDIKESYYKEMPHDGSLAIAICQGLRPNLNGVEIPQMCKDLINECWDAEPNKRPTASKLEDILGDWFSEVFDEPEDAQSTEFYQQYKEIEKKKSNYNLNSIFYQDYAKTTHASRLLEFKDLPEPQNSQEVNKEFYSQSSNFWGESEALTDNEEKKFSVEQQAQIIQKEPFGTPSSSKPK
jgi:serine/threonine protein kinase